MSRILVVGGYGGFGGELSQRLARAGHEVIVAGRSLAKAEQFCAGKNGCRPAQADRSRGMALLIAAEQPAIVIDASGPFQSASYLLVEECIAAGVSYVDLADAREFVAGIARYDQAAREAGVVVVSGASSVPALSGAVIRHLARDLEQVTAIEMAISASSRAAAGAAVTAAVVGGVGRPVRVWRGQQWSRAHGWQELRRISIEAPPSPPLRRRLVALADVPDLGLVPERVVGRPAVTFRAGIESGLGVAALWLASWPVRWGWIPSIAPLQRLLAAGHRLSRLWGGNRSGMLVRLFGRVGERRVERRWALIAEAGDGPKIPCLAAAILADRIAAGAIPPGASDAGSLLDLESFEPAFGTLAVTHVTSEFVQPPALYRRVLGERFDRLPAAVRSIHDVLRDAGAHGRAQVELGRHPLARLVARLMGFPPAGDHALHVHFAERSGTERWTRDFGGHRFASSLSQAGNLLEERFGPLRFQFELDAGPGGLGMTLKRWSMLGLPMPLFLAPRAPAREHEENGRFHFDVPVTLPGIGLVIHYRGWLEPPSSAG